MNLYSRARNCQFETLGCSRTQYLMVSLQNIFALGFLKTRRKPIFWRLLGNYFINFFDKIRHGGNERVHFVVNRDYIRRLNINQRRYYLCETACKQGRPSLDFSEHDQILVARPQNPICSVSSLLQNHYIGNSDIQHDDQLIDKYVRPNKPSRPTYSQNQRKPGSRVGTNADGKESSS